MALWGSFQFFHLHQFRPDHHQSNDHGDKIGRRTGKKNTVQPEKEGQDEERSLRETDAARTMEGLYLKVEEDGQVTRRVKYVRSSFLQTVEQSQSHWLERPIIPNQLCRPISDLYLPQLPKEEPHDR
jgi:hypothetical protein